VFDENDGSNATPSRPRSPLPSTVRLTNGVASRLAFLITRSVPLCSATKIRLPPGAKAMAVGLVSPAAESLSMKP
jgi:hypothetical protein